MTASIFHLHVPIHGMNCTSCSSRIERSLSKTEGIKSAHVNLTTEQAYIESSVPIPLYIIINIIEKLGFTVPISKIDFTIEGMSCASCSSRLERSLRKRLDIIDATVNLATERATVQGTASADQIIETVSATGFKAHIEHPTTSSFSITDTYKEKDKRHSTERHILKKHFLYAGVLWACIATLSMAPGITNIINKNWNAIIQYGLTTLLLIGPGRRFFQHGFPALWRRSPEMNSLVAIGSLAAYLYSSLVTFLPSLLPSKTVHLYYEAAAGIITLVLLGRFLESHAKSRTSSALNALIKLQAQTIRILDPNDNIKDLSIDDVTTGNIVLIRPGERLPVDGIITQGETWIDESMITGEPMPVIKKKGDKVSAGTINQQGSFQFKATAVRGDTMLSHIIKLVENAQSSKLPIQEKVDIITRWFVPVIMVVSALTFALWLIFAPSHSLSFALINAIAVLIAACPCAMGLATPTAIMMGTGKGAELGVLFRKGKALQQLSQSKVIALDKTGTLTEGRPTLTDFSHNSNFKRLELLRFAAAVEFQSEHPIAHAFIKEAEKNSLSLPEVQHFTSLTGMGVTAQCEGKTISIGSSHYMHTLNITVSTFSTQADALGREGKSPLYMTIDHDIVALIAISDPIKSTSIEAVSTLKKLGMEVVMITGDQQNTANAISHQLGITHTVANALPKGKVDALKKLQTTFGCVIFVGDGINDAPALAQADIGIAVGTGTDIALESADIILVNGHLNTLISALTLSRETLRIIKQNLFWAFSYNVILIPIAAGILYPLWGILLSPMFAAGAMALSSVCILGNTLRLHNFSAPLLTKKEHI